MPVPDFLLIGQIGSDLDVAYARIIHDFGDGFVQQALVGHASGEESVTLIFNTLSDRSAQNVLDPEDSTNKTPTQYLLDYLKRRVADGSAFNVTTTRGVLLSVYWLEPNINWKTISKKAGSTGLKFRQART